MAPALLYSKAGCPSCADARACLAAEGVAFAEIDVGGDGGDLARGQLAELCSEAAGEVTVPKVRLGEALVRSSEALRELRATSALRDLARRAGALAPEAPRQPLTADLGAVCLLHTGPPTAVWLDELRLRLASLGLSVCFLDAERLGPFDPTAPLPYSVVVNRVSDAAPPALARFVASFMSTCSSLGVPTVNGAAAYAVASSKLAQHGIFAASGLRCPASRVVRCAADVEAALPALEEEQRGRGTVLFKPNAGSFGKGIVRFDDSEELLEHARRASAYGSDGVALLQRFHRVRQTHRVFVLADRVQCGVAVSIDEGQFGGQCMASAAKRRRADGGSAVVAEEVGEAVRSGCLRALHRAGADVGSVEYLVDEESGEALYYDLNLLSTFPDPAIVGKDCWLELAEYISSKRRA